MAQPWSKILNPRFVLESVRRQGLLRSMRAGLQLAHTRSYHAFFKSRAGRTFDVLLNRNTADNRILYVFYDLAKAANGFDFFNFLVLAELERRKQKFNNMCIVIVPPYEQQYKQYHGYNSMGVTDFYARLHNIVVPGCHLIPTCRSLTICTSRQEANRIFDSVQPAVFPIGYTVRAPIAYVRPGYIRAAVDRGEKIPSITAPKISKQAAERWLKEVAGDRKVVTITLRESAYAKEKNSDVPSWTVFAKRLQSSGNYVPVFIRDTERITEEVPTMLKPFILCPEASLNILFRAAIYEKSYLNLFVNNGPAVLGVLNRASRYIIYKFLNTANTKATVEFLKNNHGIDYRGSVPGAAPWQKLVWEDDTLDVIEREFKAMCDLIEKSLASTHSMNTRVWVSEGAD